MYWYKSKESDSSFHPYSFLPKFRWCEFLKLQVLLILLKRSHKL
jgi:hypothetical protein